LTKIFSLWRPRWARSRCQWWNGWAAAGGEFRFVWYTVHNIITYYIIYVYIYNRMISLYFNKAFAITGDLSLSLYIYISLSLSLSYVY
jgi:hypothetical protein